MRNIELENKALEDIEQLTLEGVIQFGIEQAALYYDELFKQFELLAEHPLLGRPVSDSHADLLRFGFGSHIIIFSAEGDTITIRRVLHGRVDLLSHL
jgi:toxin ParE1/3/4